MKNEIKRREFIIKSCQAGITTCCLMMLGPKVFAKKGFAEIFDDEVPNPSELNYCGYKCPSDCTLLKATIENNVEQKQLAYNQWQMKERYGIDFEPEQVYCYGCKTVDKPQGIVIKSCTVRSCALSKNLECCIECKELSDCKKELWERFPDFKQQMINLQEKYVNAGNVIL